MSQMKFVQARGLINQKRYREARRVLQEIGDHPQAKDWLAKLDEMSPESSLPETPEEKLANEAAFEQWIKVEKVVNWIIALPLYALAGLLVVGALFGARLTVFSWLTALFAFVIASVSVWRVTSEERMKRYVTALRRGDQRAGAIMALLWGIAFISFRLVEGAPLTTVLFDGGLWLLVGAIWLWRSNQAMKLR